MIGYDYIRKPITGDRAKQIAQNHPKSAEKAKTGAPPQKMPDKFSKPWK